MAAVCVCVCVCVCVFGGLGDEERGCGEESTSHGKIGHRSRGVERWSET